MTVVCPVESLRCCGFESDYTMANRQGHDSSGVGGGLHRLLPVVAGARLLPSARCGWDTLRGRPCAARVMVLGVAALVVPGML